MINKNRIFAVGLFIIGITLFIHRFVEIPDILYGLLFGIGGTCEVVSMILNSKNNVKRNKKRTN